MTLSPFRGFFDLQNKMNQMLNETLDALRSRGRPQQCQLEGLTEWAPPVDVTSKDGDLGFGPNCRASSRRMWT